MEFKELKMEGGGLDVWLGKGEGEGEGEEEGAWSMFVPTASYSDELICVSCLVSLVVLCFLLLNFTP